MNQENIEYSIPNLSLRLRHLFLSQDERSFQYREEYTTSPTYLSPSSLVIANADIDIGKKIEFDYEWLASRNIEAEPWSDSYIWLKDISLPITQILEGNAAYSSMRLMYTDGGCDVYQIGFGTEINPSGFWFTELPGNNNCHMHNDVAKYHIAIEIRPGKNGENPRFVYTLTELGCEDPRSYTHTVIANQAELPNMALVFGSNRTAYRISNLTVENDPVSEFSYAIPTAQADNLVVFGTSNYQNMHFHKEVELVQVQTESIDCSVNGHDLHLLPGDILLINSNIHHMIVPHDKPAKITVLNFDMFKYLNQRENDLSILYAFLSQNKICCQPYQVYTGEEAEELTRIIDSISEEISRRKKSYQYYIRAYLLWIVAHLLRENFLPDSDGINNRSLSKIIPVIQYIHAHYSEKISLDSISHAVSMDKHYLCRLFRACTRSTIVDYINFLRLSLVAEQLSHMNTSISEAAYSSGFSSMQNFNRLFKQRYGCTPIEYRKKMM